MNRQVRDVVRYWIPEMIVFAAVGCAVGALMALTGIDLVPAMVIGMCFILIIGPMISASVRKVMTPKPEKNDT
jgi:hypothetical protein